MEKECHFTSESWDKSKEESAVFVNDFGFSKDSCSAGFNYLFRNHSITFLNFAGFVFIYPSWHTRVLQIAECGCINMQAPRSCSYSTITQMQLFIKMKNEIYCMIAYLDHLILLSCDSIICGTLKNFLLVVLLRDNL